MPIDRVLDLSYDAPAMNLALDEVILESASGPAGVSTLRFWECPTRFVVLGTGQVLAEEVVEAHCGADGVPIMRRCSAGGCVLQGPGSLNYALALRLDDFEEARTLHGSYRYILGALADAFSRLGVNAAQAGISDLAVAGRKISGNAQRRRKHAILHHGTLLYEADPAAMARYLAEPGERPEYRGERTHGDFVQALPLNAQQIRAAVRHAFGVPDMHASTPTLEETAAAEALVAEKYGSEAWVRRR